MLLKRVSRSYHHLGILWGVSVWQNTYPLLYRVFRPLSSMQPLQFWQSFISAKLSRWSSSCQTRLLATKDNLKYLIIRLQSTIVETWLPIIINVMRMAQPKRARSMGLPVTAFSADASLTPNEDVGGFHHSPAIFRMARNASSFITEPLGAKGRPCERQSILPIRGDCDPGSVIQLWLAESRIR